MIKTIRIIKILLFKYKIHLIINPFVNILLTVSYLAKISSWISNQDRVFDDYSKWNYNKRYLLYANIINNYSLSDAVINYIELGVSQGHSFRFWVENNNNELSEFHGFDTFNGLPENWGQFKKGDMKSHIPNIDDKRVHFYKGMFQDTLYKAMQNIDAKRKIILFDADCFSSTLYALSIIGPHLNKEDILIFDQFNVPLHEFRAFQIFKKCFMLNFKLIAASNNYYFCAFKMEGKI